MELTEDQKKKALLILGGVAVIVLVLLLVQGFRSFLGVRIPVVPGLSESIIGGRLKSQVIQEGSNTLEFTARTKDGKIVSDTVTFEVLPPDPYGANETDFPPDPY